ncbi:MAG TPA: ribonuclease D, partial [Armatimonadota bacterium]|nr:ribonuclease D [Armatimonadota bacterium]
MPETSVRFVSTRDALSRAVEAVRRSERVAFDTEFISEGVYEPVLCLIQLGTPEAIWILDPFALGDMSAFWQALTEPGREVVALAAREEIRFCLRYAG